MKRRDLLRAAGAATALSLLPGRAEAAWARVLSGYRVAAGLTPAQRALVTAIADVIIPRTDTPGASDVGVTDWVDLIVAEYYSADVRTPFVEGLDAIDAQVRSSRGRAFADLGAEAQSEVVASLDAPADRRTPEARAYARLKSLVVHGYFTSERVQRDVLHSQMFHDRFQGSADMPTRRTP
ncbi:MAG TPA: gluconate 2-dehydrogenase subunit 3 family protein [Gemmatimonadaceae bacterium]|nr:gluconate 2-dehydrogenase subunit 3 family protein [Gemmatimonadaceae bacterium]